MNKKNKKVRSFHWGQLYRFSQMPFLLLKEYRPSSSTCNNACNVLDPSWPRICHRGRLGAIRGRAFPTESSKRKAWCPKHYSRTWRCKCCQIRLYGCADCRPRTNTVLGGQPLKGGQNVLYLDKDLPIQPCRDLPWRLAECDDHHGEENEYYTAPSNHYGPNSIFTTFRRVMILVHVIYIRTHIHKRYVIRLNRDH